MIFSRDPRPAVRWSLHSMQILMVIAVVVGGTLFGLAFTLWPTGWVDRVLGAAILLGVAACVVWVVAYLSRPVE